VNPQVVAKPHWPPYHVILEAVPGPQPMSGKSGFVRLRKDSD